MTEHKHPRPWRIKPQREACYLVDARDVTMTSLGVFTREDEQIAREAVRAINAHDDLLAACKELLAEAEAFEENDSRWGRERNDRARAAIAKAEGHEP